MVSGAVPLGRSHQHDLAIGLQSDRIAAMAAGLGGDGVRVHTRAELQAALSRAVATRGRFQLVEIMIPRGVLSQTLQRYVEGVKRLSSGD